MGAVSKSGNRFCVRPRPNFLLARDPIAKPLTLSRNTREHHSSIFIGFPTVALTFLNQPPVVAIIFLACGKCGHGQGVPKEPISQIRARWRRVEESLK
jgi:hypothetical protein